MKAIRYTGGQGTFAENDYGRWILDDATLGARKVGDGPGEVPEAAAELLVKNGPFEYVKTASAATVTKTRKLSVEKAFRDIEKAHASASKGIVAGKAQTKDSIALGATFEVLKAAITDTYGSLAQAPAKVQKQFASVEKNQGDVVNQLTSLPPA